jgi:drug/metabolite transporter (DMT)-like permease
MSREGQAYLELTLAMIIVGSSVVVGKLVVASFPVFLANGLRFGIASVCLVALLLKAERRIPVGNRKDLLILFWQAFTGVFLFGLLLLYGLKYTSASESGIITSTTPAVIGLISFFFLKERPTWTKSAGIALAVLGVLTINMLARPVSAGSGDRRLLGNLLVFGAVIGEALFTILGKVVSGRVSPLAIATLLSLLGFLMFLPFAVYEGLAFDFSTVSAADWLPILYYGTIVTVGAYILWYRGVAQVPASTAAVFTGVLPIAAVLLSHLVLGERLAWAHLLGVACVLLAIGLIAWPVSAQRRREAVYTE